MTSTSQTDSYLKQVPADSPSRGGDVTVYVCDINQPSFPNPFNNNKKILFL